MGPKNGSKCSSSTYRPGYRVLKRSYSGTHAIVVVDVNTSTVITAYPQSGRAADFVGCARS